MDEKQRKILEQVARGQMSAEEGNRQLVMLESGPSSNGFSGSQASEPPEPLPSPTASRDEWKRYRAWKWLPFALALLLTLVAATWLLQGWQAQRLGIGFWLAWIPFGMGLAGMAFAWNLRWLHLRVYDPNGSKTPFRLNLHLPLPVSVLTWAVRKFGGASRLAGDRQQEVLDLLANLRTGEPIVVDVDDKDGTRVEVVID